MNEWSKACEYCKGYPDAKECTCNRILPSTVRVLAVQDQATGIWMAFCLDLRFTAQAPTLKELPEVLIRGIGLHHRLAVRRGREPFEGPLYPPFPASYIQKYEAAEPWQAVEVDEVSVEFRVSPAGGFGL